MTTTPNNLPVPGPLSPAAQAVRDAAFDADFEIDFANLDATFEASINKIAAAILREAAGYLFPSDTAKECYYHLLAIATELDDYR